MRLTRDEERRLEVWGEVRPYEPPDFDGMCFALWMDEKARKREQYRDLRLFAPREYRELLAKHGRQYRERQAQRADYRARISNPEAREMRRMWAAGAMIKDIAKAFRRTERVVRNVLDGATHTDAGGPIRGPMPDGKRQHRQPCWGRTPELVSAVAASSGSDRSVARALGTNHKMVRAIRRDLAAQAQAAE